MNVLLARGCGGEITSDQGSATVALHDLKHHTQSYDKISFKEAKMNVCTCFCACTICMHVQYVCGHYAVSLQPSEDSAYCGILCKMASDADRVLY